VGKFFTWVSGILAVVIAGVAVAYLTKPAPAPPPPAPTTLQGMVYDGSSNLPVRDALVEVDVVAPASSEPFHDPTDGNGSYLFDLSDLSKSSKIMVRVKIKGYQDATPAEISIVSGLNRHDFEVRPLPSPVPPPVNRPSMARPTYIQKTFVQAVKVQVQRKP
jgi:hypothetical protein